MARTFGADGAKIPSPRIDGQDDADQLVMPPDLDDDNEDTADAPDIAAIADSDVEIIDPRTAELDKAIIDAETSVEAQVAKVQEPAPSADIAVLAEKFDVTTSGEVWPYDLMHFQGDVLGVRLPTKQALAGFSLASSKYVAAGVKNDLTGLFIARHLSPESYGRVFSRLMDPDDEAYTVETVGELFNAIVTASIEADKPE